MRYNNLINRILLPKKKKEDQYDLFLYFTKHEKFSESMKVLTNMPDPHASSMYFRQWDIEWIFNTMKQEFDIENIRTQSLAILYNTIVTIKFAVVLSNACFNSGKDQNTIKGTRLFRIKKKSLQRSLKNSQEDLDSAGITTPLSPSFLIVYNSSKKTTPKKIQVDRSIVIH